MQLRQRHRDLLSLSLKPVCRVQFNSGIRRRPDVSAQRSGRPSEGTQYATVNVSASQASRWGFSTLAVLPPSGYSFSGYDSGGYLANTTCTTCTLASPTLTATDLVAQFNDWNGTLPVGPMYSSPYVEDSAGIALCLDCNTSTAPTFTQTGSGGTVNNWIALKTTAGTYSIASSSDPISIAAHAMEGLNGPVSCSPACPALTIPSTALGDLFASLPSKT